MTKRLLILLIGLCAASASAQEERVADYARTDFYLGASAVCAPGTGIGSGGGINSGVDMGAAGGIALRAGYRMTPHVAAEMTFEWLGGFDAGFGGNPGIDTWSLGVGLRAYLLTGRVQPYGLLGLGLAKGNVEKPSDDFTLQIDGTGGELRLGGGVEVYLTEEVVLDLGLAYPFRMGDLEDFDYLTINAGVSYRF